MDNEHIARLNPIRYRGYYYDTETGLYYLKTRYYDSSVGRFISPDSVEFITADKINGLNLYAYCLNDPINKIDPTGQFGFFAILGIIVALCAVAVTAHDVYQIVRQDGEGVSVEVSDNNVKVNNSYKIITPWVRWGYSLYLNEYNKETKDIIQGSTSGVVFEWALHNYAAWLGVGGESTKHVDLGKTLFADGKFHPLIDSNGHVAKTGLMSIGMQLLYVMFGNPFAWISDLFTNWGL